MCIYNVSKETGNDQFDGSRSGPQWKTCTFTWNRNFKSIKFLISLSMNSNISINFLFKLIWNILKYLFFSLKFVLIWNSISPPDGNILIILSLLCLPFPLKSKTLKPLILWKLHEFNGLNYFSGCTCRVLLILVRLRSNASKGSF